MSGNHSDTDVRQTIAADLGYLSLIAAMTGQSTTMVLPKSDLRRTQSSQILPVHLVSGEWAKAFAWTLILESRENPEFLQEVVVPIAAQALLTDAAPEVIKHFLLLIVHHTAITPMQLYLVAQNLRLVAPDPPPNNDWPEIFAALGVSLLPDRCPISLFEDQRITLN